MNISEYFLSKIDDNFGNHNPLNYLLVLVGIPIIGLFTLFSLIILSIIGWLMFFKVIKEEK